MARKKKQYCIGYAREWGGGPSLDEQVARLKAFGCWNVYAESRSDTSTVGKQLSLALIDARPSAGDYFVVVDLACLGSSARLVHVLTTLQRNGVDLYVIAGDLDSRGPDGERQIAEALKVVLLLQDIKSQAIRDGLAEARQQGRIGGRRAVMSADRLAGANELIASGQHSMKEIAKKLGVSRSSLYNSGLSAMQVPRRNKGRPPGAAQGAVPMTGSD
jgi:DNA invertase Pin-like site-specific DNA recombinase